MLENRALFSELVRHGKIAVQNTATNLGSAFADMVIDRRTTPAGRVPRILVVDDDPRFLARIRSWLGSDVSVMCAETSRSAQEAAHTSRVDVALIDYRLRGQENGLVLARSLRADHGTPFILVSQYLTTALVVEAMKLGAETVLDKPITPAVLLGAIREALPAGSAGLFGSQRTPLVVQIQTFESVVRSAMYLFTTFARCTPSS